jgi:hypothetical protein
MIKKLINIDYNHNITEILTMYNIDYNHNITEILTMYEDNSGNIFYVENNNIVNHNMKPDVKDDLFEKVDESDDKPTLNKRSEALKRAQKKYRENNIEKYNSIQKKVYENHKDKPEWKEKFNESCKLSSEKSRQKKKAEKIANGTYKPPGRPRKNLVVVKQDALASDNPQVKQDALASDNPQVKDDANLREI